MKQNNLNLNPWIIDCYNFENLQKQLNDFQKDYKNRCSSGNVNVNVNANMNVKLDRDNTNKLYQSVIGPTVPVTDTFIQRLNQNQNNRNKIIQNFRGTVYRNGNNRQANRNGNRGQNPQKYLPIPDELKGCGIYNDIIKSECNSSLDRRVYQREYERLSSTVTYTTGSSSSSSGDENEKNVLQFSILDSIVTDFITSNNLGCIGGDIELWLTKSVDRVEIKNRIFSEDKFEVIPGATTFNFIKNIRDQCLGSQSPKNKKKKYLYFPLTIHWIDKKNLSQFNSENPSCNSNGKNICDGNHAMGVLVNIENFTITVHEPNSKRVGWYIPVSQYIESLFNNFLSFNPSYFSREDISNNSNNNSNKDNSMLKFQLEDSGAFEEGLQATSGLQQCSFFSSLFILIRLQCSGSDTDTDSLTGPEIVNSLKQYGPKFIELLLRQYTCWLYHYAQIRGILAANIELPDQWLKILNILTNHRYYRISVNKIPGLYQQIGVIEQVARFDIVSALKMLYDLESELNIK